MHTSITKSDYLFARPSFSSGVSRILDLGGTLNEYNFMKIYGEPDLSAYLFDAASLYQDWRAIGLDLFGAAREYDRKR